MALAPAVPTLASETGIIITLKYVRLGLRPCFAFSNRTYQSERIGGENLNRGVALKSDSDRQSSIPAIADDYVALLYDELRVIARREHYRAGSPQTLQATALIGEAYIKLQRRDGWESKSHFLGCAATAMRHILIDAARARLAVKRDAEVESYTRSLDVAAAAPQDGELIRLGDAIKALSNLDPKLAQVIDCRFFAGMDEIETAAVLGVSERTVRRWWTQARAWVYREMTVA